MTGDWVKVDAMGEVRLEDFEINTFTAPLRVWCHDCKVSHEALDWPVTCRPYWQQPH